MAKKWEGRLVLTRPHDPAWGRGRHHKPGACPICDGFLSSMDGFRLEQEGATAYIVLPDGVGAPSSLPRGVEWTHLDGWDGSYHDPHYYPSCNRTVLFVRGKRAGRLGKLRKAYKAALEEARLPQGRHPRTGGIIAARKGLYREGD